MKLILKILAVGLIHAAFFTAYPETGPTGDIYLWVSPVIWCGFILFINTSTALIRFISGAAGFIINLAAFALMGLALAATLPQQDRVSVLEKVQQGKFPDRKAVTLGLRRFGVDLDHELKDGAGKLDKEAQKAIKQLGGK